MSDETPRRPARSSGLWMVPAILLLVVGAVSLLSQIYIFPPKVDDEDWKEPAEYVVERIGPGDVIRVSPSWNEQALPFLYEIGDQVSRQDHPVPEDLYAYDKIWLLAEQDRLREGLDRIPFDVGSPPIESFGYISVAQIDVPNHLGVTYDFRDKIADARVAHVKKGDVKHCKNYSERDKRWDCGRRDKFIYVGRGELDLGQDPHRCIWAHPVPGKRHLRITYPDVRLGKKLRIRAGLDMKASRSNRGVDVHLTVEIGGKKRAEETYPARITSWDALDIDTTDLAGEKKDVILEIRAKKIRDRFFCLNGWVYE